LLRLDGWIKEIDVGIFRNRFSAPLLSSSSQQSFSAAILSYDVVSRSFSAVLFGSPSQQPFSAAIQGWWSASNIILLWSGVGGQLLTSSWRSTINTFIERTLGLRFREEG